MIDLLSPSRRAPLARARFSALAVIAFAIALSYGGGFWLHLVHLADWDSHGAAHGVAAWLRDSTLTLPLVTAAVWAALRLADWLLARHERGGSRLFSAAVTAGAVALLASAAAASAGPLLVELLGSSQAGRTSLFICSLAGVGSASAATNGSLARVAQDGLLAVVANLLIAAAISAALSGGIQAVWRTIWSMHRLPRATPARWRWTRIAAALALVAAIVPATLQPIAAAQAGFGGVCASATRNVIYNITAFQVAIPVNGWGDVIENGMMFALDNGTSLTRAAARTNGDAFPNVAAIRSNPNLASPLVIRAAVGDCITIRLHNDIIGKRIGLHADGIAKDPNDSDGAFVGNNPDTTTPYFVDRTYTWFAHREGQWPINDYGSGTNFKLPFDPVPDPLHGPRVMQDTTSLGLYGALIVLPQGSTWHDIRTGDDMVRWAGTTGTAIESDVQADAHVPGLGPNGAANDFRDYVVVFMDENEEIVNINPEFSVSGVDPRPKKMIFPATGLPDAAFGINYRSEPLRNRLMAVETHRGGERWAWDVDQQKAVLIPAGSPRPIHLPTGETIAPADHWCDGYSAELGRVADDPGARCYGEEMHLQSWIFGDPGKLSHVENGKLVIDSDNNILKAYRNDPVYFRLVHPGMKETHTWHQHTNRWFFEPDESIPSATSTRLDVQSTSPGTGFLLKFEGGAGNIQGTVGDQVFHCHLYPHFAQGFWGTVRVLDRVRTFDGFDGSQPQSIGVGANGQAAKLAYADGTPIEPLRELPDRLGKTPGSAIDHPGFPLWVKGEYHQKAFRAPGTIVADPFEYGTKTVDAAGKPHFVADPTRTTYFRRPGDSVRNDPNSPGGGPGQVTPLEAANMANNLGAGQDGLKIENAIKADAASGQKSITPGAMFLDPCPAGAPERYYFPAEMDAKVIYNRAGWYNPNNSQYVEVKPADPSKPNDRANLETIIGSPANPAAGLANARRLAINAGQHPDPYTIRSRIGECVNMRTTNAGYLDNSPDWPLDIFGNTAFQGPTPMSEVTTHVHIVRFDQEGTDGTSVGWNYVQGPLEGQTYAYRWFVDTPLRTVFFHDHQFPNSRQQSGLWSAMNVEPANASWTKPDGSAFDGVGPTANIIVPGGTSFREFTVHYSDFVPMYDAASQPIDPPSAPDRYGQDQGVMAINYSNEPFSLRINSQSLGAKYEPAYVFSSAVHGDPGTPIFRAYPGDPVIIRFMDGAHEEEHNFTLAGHRWLREPDDADSNLMDAQAMNIAEWFNFDLQGPLVKRPSGLQGPGALADLTALAGMPFGATKVLAKGAGPSGDYLYGSMPLNDLWSGMWGIFRVLDKQVSTLKPLPDRAALPLASKGNEYPAIKPGGALSGPDAKKVGDPCPAGSPVKSFNVSAIQQKIVYNARSGENDPNGVLFALNEDLDATGKLKPGVPVKPLYIRANQGDCVNILFTNRLPLAGSIARSTDPQNPFQSMTVALQFAGGPVQTVSARWPAGNRASIHPGGLMRYDVLQSDGSAVGYNYDTTVAPNASIVYRYYVDTYRIGAVNLQDLGNLPTNRHHGAWGSLIAEPLGASYLDPTDLTKAVRNSEVAVIKWSDANGPQVFREFVIGIQDGLNLSDAAGQPIFDQAAGFPGFVEEAPDPEDQGEKGVNYRTERFLARLDNMQAKNGRTDIANILSSSFLVGGVPQGDPATPLFKAYRGDPVMVRILNSSDLPRVHAFGIFGHEWRMQGQDANSNIISTQGSLNTSRVFNAYLLGGAGGVGTSGGPAGVTGDFLYGDHNFDQQLSGGIWGIFRVYPGGTDFTATGIRPIR